MSDRAVSGNTMHSADIDGPEKTMIAPGDSHHFRFSPAAMQAGDSVDYAAGADILLHVKVSATRQVLIVNGFTDGRWDKPVTLPLSPAQVAQPLAVTLDFLAKGTTVTCDGLAPVLAPFALAGARLAIRHPASITAGDAAPPLAMAPLIAQAAPAPAPATPREVGAMDHVSPHAGPMGWAMFRDSPGTPVKLQAVAGTQMLAEVHTVLPRPDLEKLAGGPTRCGFAFPWHRFDADRVATLAKASPDAPLQIRIAETGTLLKTACAPLTLARLAGYLADQPGKRHPEDQLISDYAALTPSGLLDKDWYRQTYGIQGDPLLHYLTEGEAAGHQPNFYFEPTRATASLATASLATGGTVSALALYLAKPWLVTHPGRHFDQAWYAMVHALPQGMTPLAHFLANRAAQSPNPFFDPAIYRASAPAAAATADPYRHYLDNPDQARLRASGNFDARAYLANTPDAAAAPFLHFLDRMMARG